MAIPHDWTGPTVYTGIYGTVITISIILALRQRGKVNASLLAWSKVSGAEVVFGAPPAGSGQTVDSLLEFYKKNDHPFLHPIYDMANEERNLIRFANIPNVMLISGWRRAGRSGSRAESWFIVDTDDEFPNGQVSLTPGWPRIFTDLNNRQMTDLPRNVNAWSPDSDRFRLLCDSDLIASLRDQKCVAFRTQGRHVEICFDGRLGSETWDELYPKAMEIVDRIRRLVGTARA